MTGDLGLGILCELAVSSTSPFDLFILETCRGVPLLHQSQTTNVGFELHHLDSLNIKNNDNFIVITIITLFRGFAKKLRQTLPT